LSRLSQDPQKLQHRADKAESAACQRKAKQEPREDRQAQPDEQQNQTHLGKQIVHDQQRFNRGRAIGLPEVTVESARIAGIIGSATGASRSPVRPLNASNEEPAGRKRQMAEADVE